ncbi:MAG TPA: mersacidin/lichenicidin family type 2 lantibiotic [Ktedonobacteraceae bacterium]|nr:mersacidin/lichenicidin family type 2 lantibiotic [Ktedonobacteraceae bacterium]
MINILRAWGKEAHSQSLSTQKQAMMPAEAAELIDLADAALQAVYGGCGQSIDDSYGHHHSHGGYPSEGNHTRRRRHHHQSGYGCDGYGNGGCGGSSYENCGPSSW